MSLKISTLLCTCIMYICPLQNAPYEHASLSDLIKTDHKILNKVMMVFASLCSEIGEHKEKVSWWVWSLMSGCGH